MSFFDSVVSEPRNKAFLRVPPPTPETSWRAPTDFPDLTTCSGIGFDCEVKELDWEHGPGWSRGQAKIVGIALEGYWSDGKTVKLYLPTDHEVEPEYNLDANKVYPYVKAMLETPHIRKFGGNLYYDCGNLGDKGIFPKGELHDCQLSEPLLEETGEVALEAQGQKYLGVGKESNQLYSWIMESFRPKESRWRGEIWRASPRLVGPYAEQDAQLPREILQKQWPLLVDQQLLDVYRMECDLIPLMVAMRRRGVYIDVPKAEQAYESLGKIQEQMYAAMSSDVGFQFSVDSSSDLERMFNHYSVPFARTAASKNYPNGQASFTRAFLESVEHPIARQIIDLRRVQKIRNTFVKSYLLESNVNGVVHGEFHQLRSESSDDGGSSKGTRSGRFSSSNPNLQNIPTRTDETEHSKIVKIIRELYIPFPDSIAWMCGDYSQIEYRFLAHYAVGPGSDALRQQYNENPDTDYHDSTYERVCTVMGWDFTDKPQRKSRRGKVKNCNFGLVYGMMKPKLKRMWGLDNKEGDKLFNGYHQANPYVKPTMDACADEAQQNGYITTILGRRSRFDLWVPAGFGNDAIPLPLATAIKAYGTQIQRASTHKAVNRRLQGSAADQIKLGMLTAYKAGVFDVIGVPTLTVHDELSNDLIEDTPLHLEGHAELKRIMETCIPLRVPVKFEVQRGTSWGDAKS